MPLKNHNLNILSSSSGILFIIGSGPLPKQWQTLPLLADRRADTADKLPEKEKLRTLTETLKPQAILWQAADRPIHLANEIKSLPKEIPLLLRYPRTLEAIKDKKLVTVLRSRANNLLLSRPLRFWPPTCRVWEICAGKVLGSIEKIKLTLNLKNDATKEKNWTVSEYDVIDFCSCLLEQPAPSEYQRRLDNSNESCLEACFPGRTRVLIKYLNLDREPGIGMEQLTVVGQHGTLELRRNDRLPKDEKTEAGWILERSFKPCISGKKLRPLPLFAPDPIALELKYFFHRMKL